MKLKYKIFITLIATSCLILILVVGVMQVSIRKNFIDFINDVEFDKQDKMLALLKQNYRQNTGWDGFRRNPEAWHELLFQSSPDDLDNGPGKHPPFDRQKEPLFSKPLPPPPPHPMDQKPLHLRLCLFDADKKMVAGDCRQQGKFNYHPIVLDGQTIGWLGLENRSEMIKPLELAFLEKQSHSFYIIGLGILVLALIISYIVSRHLLSPVRELVRGTRAMGEFDFDTRIMVTSTDELGALANDFNLMAKTLKQYETLRKNWISDISHELRTPVAVILSKIEALQDGVREMTPEFLDSLHKDILGLGKLINDLHLISLADSKNILLNPRSVPVLSSLNKALDAFLIRFEQQDIEIEKDWKGDEPIKVKGDIVLLNRVFSNLFENTLKYTDSPGSLNISHHVKEDQIVIDIEDSYPGVPEDCLESIFDRLYRVEQSRNRSLGGSGLGLSISQQIISLHGGRIKGFNSSLGGLGVRIEFPLDKK